MLRFLILKNDSFRVIIFINSIISDIAFALNEENSMIILVGHNNMSDEERKIFHKYPLNQL